MGGAGVEIPYFLPAIGMGVTGGWELWEHLFPRGLCPILRDLPPVPWDFSLELSLTLLWQDPGAGEQRGGRRRFPDPDPHLEEGEHLQRWGKAIKIPGITLDNPWDNP